MSRPIREYIFRTSPEKPWRYSDLDKFQRKMALEVCEGRPGALIFSEVSPVITLGQRAKAEKELLLSEEELTRRDIEVYPTDRGGLATYHGPGQWVAFVVERLEHLTGDGRGVSRAVRGLLSCAKRVAEAHGVKAEIREGNELGVWTDSGKLASVGVRVRDGVLLHGLSLNVFPTPESFVGLRPCGLDCTRPAFLAEGAKADREGAAFSDQFMHTKQALSEEIRETFQLSEGAFKSAQRVHTQDAMPVGSAAPAEQLNPGSHIL